MLFKHRVLFTRGAFDAGNPAVRELLAEGGGRRVWAVVEEQVAAAWPSLCDDISGYLSTAQVAFSGLRVLPGGEEVKADDALVRRVWEDLDAAHIDRHSYLLAVGGGAFLDAVGFAAATAHRGVRLVRFPTTTLSQDDSGVGVKCAINGFGKKNWIGAFAVPFAVVNDFAFLHSQDDATKRAGLVEAVKVAVVKDAGFFAWIEANAGRLAKCEPEILETCVERSALLHARHIAEGGDPFETGSSRPLDYGHWAAHKLEASSGYALGHAQAVAVGVALDTLYSTAYGLLERAEAERILAVLRRLGLMMYHPALETRGADGRRAVYGGLAEFREHLGGELTLLLLGGIGAGVDVHEMDEALLEECIEELKRR